MNMFKRFVAFAIAVVMICGMLPVSAAAVENHDHSAHSDIQPFTSTADLIEQVKAQLLAAGKTYSEEAEDQDLVDAVESESEYSYDQAQTLLGLGFFNNRTGAEGQISTAHLNLDEATMTALVESTLKAYYLDGIVEVEYVVEDGIVTAITFSMRESFAAGLDEIETGINAEEAEEDAPTAVASYKVSTAAEEPAEEKPFPFTDVPEKNWAYPAINYLYQRGIVSGVSANKYGPNVKVTRAQAITMIWRAMGEPEAEGKNPFTDVKSGQFYTEAVVWGSENGIVAGTSTTKFSPNANITREQLVVFIYRLANFEGLDVSEKASLSSFKDAGKISKYAREAVQWAIAAGLVSGYNDGTFRPQGNATRAEYAQVLYKYLLNAHTLVRVEAVASTCSVKGNIEYWYCSKCGKLFADAKGKKQIEEKDTVLDLDANAHNPTPVAEISPTCTTTGVAAHYKCTCGLVVDANGNLVSDMSKLTLAATGHAPAADAETTVWNWERIVTYNYNTDEDGNPTFDQGLTDAEGNPVPDFPVDENGNMVASLYFNPETGEITAGYQEIVTWECASMSFTCAGCGEAFESETTVSSYVMTEEWIENATEEYATAVATDLITEYVTEKAMNYYGETGSAPTEEMQNQWVAEAQNDPEINAQVEQAATAKAMELYRDLNSTIYVATTGDTVNNAEGKAEDLVVQTNELNATRDQLQRDWATMCSFNEYYSKYFGLVAPYWASKNTEASPFGAVIYMCSQEEQPFIPNADMDYMISMLTQAFMSYVMQYGHMLDAMIADAMAQVNYEELDEIDKLLLLHDWLAQYGTFDMQSLVDITTGESSGNDPIAMTAFGVLLNDQIEKAEGAMWDGGVCLGYAATYAMLVQQAFGVTQDDAAIVDFAKIQFLTNVAESSVASGDSGFGDGDAMFNSAHYLNAVKLADGTWYYIDACYDDINTEVISQQRVETDGNVSHTSFLIAPATWEEMYEESFQYMDSLYDGKVWQRVYDGESGYYMMDKDRNVYTYAEAQAMLDEAEQNDEPLQMFYYYEVSDTEDETRYDDTTYEEAWFVSANSAVNYDPETQYFYYTSGAITSYSTLKDMFGEDEEEDDTTDDTTGSMDTSMDQADMLEYKYDPSAQDKIVRRPVGASNEPSSSGGMMSQPTDEECEVLFHFGYGTTGAQAHAQFEEDSADSGMNMGTEEDTEEEIVTGAWYDLCQGDAVYLSNYPDLVHSTVMIDGNIYFNIANCIYTFNFSAADMAANTIENITTLELVKVKEYNEISYGSNGKRFTGMSFVADDAGTTLYYHPIAALSVHNDITWSEGEDGNPVRTATETLHVSIGTNLSNSYKTEDDEAYVVEARNFNPDYYRFMEEEETEDTNTNTEFMWCANVVEKMVVADLLTDLAEGETEVVSVEAYCAQPAFTETRTVRFGLSTDGVKTIEEGTAQYHSYAADEEEGTNICSVCLEDHDHDYTYATGDDIDFVWSTYTEESADAEGATTTVTKLTATAIVPCSGDYCGVDHEIPEDDVVVVDNGDGSFTATATHGTVSNHETKTVDQVLHNVHDYGAPVFTWTAEEVTEDVTDADGNTTTVTKTVYTATATFSCEADEADCVGSDAEGDRVVTVTAAVSNETGEWVATLTGPDGLEYTDTLHVFSAEKDADGKYLYVNIVMDEGKDTYTATYTCTVCEHTVTVTGNVVKTVEPATCEEKGLTTYTATPKADAVLTETAGKTYSALPEAKLVETEEIAAKGHSYEGTPAWSEDLTACAVTYTCSGCDDSYTVNATVGEPVVVDPTCTEAGSKTVTATVYGAEGEILDTFEKVVTIPATDHSYGDATVVWTYLPASETTEEGMNCSVEYECANCDHAEAQSVTKPVKADDGSWSASYIYNGESITVTHTHAAEDTCTCGYTAVAAG